ncbi:MAG: hypothetical protein HY717_11820 [Planctomycetes bacterium]|nr:hypothetical protein [Planctomycetota bacterium]
MQHKNCRNGLLVFLAGLTGWPFGQASPGDYPAVEVEEEVARCAPPNNGAGPLWCYGAPLLARQGEAVFASLMETGAGVPPLSNTRPRLFRKRGDGPWELVYAPEGFRHREPCPLVGLAGGSPAGSTGGALFLSINPSTAPPGTQYGPCDPQLLKFDLAGGSWQPEEVKPPWPAGATFTDHSYRGLAADGGSGEILLLNIDARKSDQVWCFRDGAGKWARSGSLRFPIRACYPQAALRQRAAHVLAIGDIVEPVEEWRRYKKEKTGRDWDYVFRRLFYAWSPDLAREDFQPPLEIESLEAAAGHISNLDLWLSESGEAYVLYIKQAVQSEPMRDRFFPGTPIRRALVCSVFKDGKLIKGPQAVWEGGEGSSYLSPGHARFHAGLPNRFGQRLFAVYSVQGALEGKAIQQLRLQPILPEPGPAKTIPLEFPFTSFFTACERGGSAPGETLDLFGVAGNGEILRYARVRISSARPAARGAAKKLIEFGWDEPDPAFLREHAKEMEATPFDGCVFHINYKKADGGAGNFTWEGWGKRAFTAAELEPALEDLKAAPLTRLRHNFLRFNTTPADLDWFDDFAAILQNARLAAQVAREGKAAGLLFDIEQYNAPLFDYRKQRDAKTKPWPEYAAQVRKRGREVLEAFQEGYPDLTVFLTFGYSLPWHQSRSGKTARPLEECSYGLLAPFLDGLVEACRGKTRLVDGHELSYAYKEPAQFSQAYHAMREEALAMVADPARYARVFSFAFGLWMDQDWRRKGWSVENFEKNYFTPAAFQKAVGAAFDEADEYVWIYTETPRWWTAAGKPEKLPQAYVEAVVQARQDTKDRWGPAEK